MICLCSVLMEALLLALCSWCGELAEGRAMVDRTKTCNGCAEIAIGGAMGDRSKTWDSNHLLAKAFLQISGCNHVIVWFKWHGTLTVVTCSFILFIASIFITLDIRFLMSFELRSFCHSSMDPLHMRGILCDCNQSLCLVFEHISWYILLVLLCYHGKNVGRYDSTISLSWRVKMSIFVNPSMSYRLYFISFHVNS